LLISEEPGNQQNGDQTERNQQRLVNRLLGLRLLKLALYSFHLIGPVLLLFSHELLLLLQDALADFGLLELRPFLLDLGVLIGHVLVQFGLLLLQLLHLGPVVLVNVEFGG
jgi:hypothetical protein